MIDGEQFIPEHRKNESKKELEGKALEEAGNIFSYISKGRPGYEVSRNMENFRNLVSKYYGKEENDTKEKQRIQDLHITLEKYIQNYV